MKKPKLTGIAVMLLIGALVFLGCPGNGNDPQPTTFTVTVVGGIIGTDGTTTTGVYAPGDAVTVTANEPEAGKGFKEWTASSAVLFADSKSPTTTFAMPEGNVTITANYGTLYEVTVNGGTSGTINEYVEGAVVTITAGDPEIGQGFKNWTADPAVTFDDPNNPITTFTMPEDDVVITANFDTGYAVTVTGGTTDYDRYAQGATVTIMAEVDDDVNEELAVWETDDTITFVNPNSPTTTFTMPASAVTITAKTLYRYRTVHLKTSQLWGSYQALSPNSTFFVDDDDYLALGPQNGYEEWILMATLPDKDIDPEGFVTMTTGNTIHWMLAFKNAATGNFINVQDIITLDAYKKFSEADEGFQVSVLPFKDEPGFYWGASTYLEAETQYGIQSVTFYNGEIQDWAGGAPQDNFGVLTVLGDFANETIKPSNENSNLYAIQFLGSQTEFWNLHYGLNSSGQNWAPDSLANFYSWGPSYHACFDIIWAD